MRKITKHGLMRIKERVGESYNERSLLKEVLLKGDTKENYSKEFYEYLCQKSVKGAKIKIYKDFIYILSKNKKNLITVYHVPDNFIPIEQYFIKKGKSDLLYFSNRFINKEIKINTKYGYDIHGILKGVIGKNYAEKILMKDYIDNYIIIDSDDIENMTIDDERVLEEMLLNY